MRPTVRAVGVVVPAHDEELLLPGCLAGVAAAAAEVPDLPVAVVVVADACSDLTVVRARAGGAQVVEVAARNVGLARAAGFRAAIAALDGHDPARVWLATTDADSVVPAGWLRVQRRLADAGADAVAGTVHVADWAGHPPGVRERFAAHYDGSDGHHHVHGANFGCRASAYRSCGGVPGLAVAEDVGLLAALEAAGVAVLRTGAMPVTTSARANVRAAGGFGDFLSGLAG